MPRLSILLPCRDAAAHLGEAIASIEAQDFTDYEVIAIDDASSDATPSLLAAWADRDPRVRRVSGPGRGIAAALAAGHEAAAGELIARMDADDVAEPDRLRRQVALLEGRPDVVACGTLVRYFPDAEVRGGALRYERWLNSLVEPAEIARDVFVECPIPHPTLVIRHAALRALGGYRPVDWPEDYDLVLRLWAAGHRMAKVPRVLLRWRERSDRASRTDPRYSPEAFRRCKIHFLLRTLLQGRDGAVVWGAGPVGKAVARELIREGVPVRAFVDLDPRKIGQTVHGAPVIRPAGVEHYRGALALAAVGSAAARHEIRAELTARGWREMQDFVAVA